MDSRAELVACKRRSAVEIMRIKNLSLGYSGRKIVEDINFTIKEGDYVCIVGENGSGKTTLMKAILGLIKPFGGEIELLNGVMKSEIGYIPQETLVKSDFPATVSEIVRSGCINLKGSEFFYNNHAKKTADKNIERMGISALKHRSFRELSGGQRQRVLLARALCSAKKVLFLDEPVAGLDAATQTELYKILRELNAEGMSIVMISHDLEEAIKNADYILSIKKGHAKIEPVQEYIANRSLNCNICG